MRIAIIHGTMGSPQGNWFPWLKSELEQRGHEVIVPTFPTPDRQDVDTWCATFFHAVPPPYGDTILIGHSIGATCALSVLEHTTEPFAASVFVAPVMDDIAFEEYNILNRSFYARAFNWKTIKGNAGHVIILYGDNDPYVPLSHAEILSRNIGTPVKVINQGGHLNAESGYITFPDLIEIIRNFAARD